MKILALDTSTETMSLALLEGNSLVAEVRLSSPRGHAEALPEVLADVLRRVGWEAKDLERVVVGIGPGSYTGMRVGLAFGKSMAYALGIEVVGVSTLEALAATVPGENIVPILDARRDRVYAGLYAQKDGCTSKRDIDVCPLDEVLSWGESLLFTGPGLKNEDYRRRILEAGHTIAPAALWDVSAYALGLCGAAKEAEEFSTVQPLYLRKTRPERRLEGDFS